MKKNSRSARTHKHPRKSNRGWIIALIGAILLFLGIILIFLMVGSSSAETSMPAASAVNVEKDIPETDMGDLVYHEPAVENVVMQGGFGYVNNELLVTLDSSESLPQLKEYLAGIGSEVVGEIPLTADYQIMLPGTYTEEELETIIEQVKCLPYVERSSLNYAFELEDASNQYYPDDKKWDDWETIGGNNWNMKAIDAPGAWVYRNQMQSVNVGVIDGRFDPYHEDLYFEEMPRGNETDMGLLKSLGLPVWSSKERHATHVAGIIGAVFNNKKGVCGVAPNVKLYGVDCQSPAYRKAYEEKTKETSDFEEAINSNLFSLMSGFGYLVVEQHCQVINISQGGFSISALYNASRGDGKAIDYIQQWNNDMSDFLKKLHNGSKVEFIICKSAGNDNNENLFFEKAPDDEENLSYISYDEYLKYMRGDYTAKEKEDLDKRFKRYVGQINKSSCEAGKVDARWDIFSAIADPEVKKMIVVVGAVQNAGAHSKNGCQHTGYEITSYSNRGNRVDIVAPGGDNKNPDFRDSEIYSTVPDGSGYGYMSGTSMAAPHVAGVAAMIFGIDPTFTAKEVKDIIVSTATGSYGSVKEQYPLLNARMAVEKAIKLRNKKAKGQIEDNRPFEPNGEHQYQIFYDKLTWEEAKAACEAKGGHLATITSEEEQKKLNLYNGGNHNLWIGGYKNAEGQWCWVTGEPWEYENWGDGEPNNSSNVVADENRVAMWPEKWNDLANGNIYEQNGYICEWEATNDEGTVEEDGYAGHVYEFYTLPESEWESGPITWEQAERRCEWKGGHLAVIESQAENDYLYAAMKQKGYENACFGYSDKETEGSWKWVNGVQSAYTNWHSGEPNHQNGNEHYAMFYQKFDDGTWNDGNGLIDADCAYICEWDDPADKQPSGDTFTERQLKIIAKDLGVPENLDVQIKQYPKTYWDAAGLWDIYVEVNFGGKVIAAGSFDMETGEMGRNLYIYSPNQ